MATQIIDPFEKKNISIVDPFEKKQIETIKKLEPVIPGNEEIIDPSKEPADPFEIEKGFFEKKIPITTEQIKSIWNEPLGISPENKQKLKVILGDENTLLGKFNNYLVDTSSKIIDTSLRGLNTLGFVASGIAGDGLNLIYKTINKEPGGAGERLTRDINGILIDVMGRSGTSFEPVASKPRTLRSKKTREEITDVIEYARKDENTKTEVIKDINKIVDNEVTQIKKNDVIIGEKISDSNLIDQTNKINEIVEQKQLVNKEPPVIDTFETLNRRPALPIETVKKITDASIKFIKEENIKLDKNKPISLQIQEILLSDKYEVPEIIRRIAEDNKIPIDEFNSWLFPSVSQSAKELNLYSQAAKYLRDKLDPTGEIFSQSKSPIFGVIKRLDNIARGLLVTRLATAVRNYISQTARIGLDTIQNFTDYVLQQAVKPFADPIQFQKNKVSPLANFSQLVNNFRQWRPKNFKEIRQKTDLLLKDFPQQRDRLFLRYSSDVKNASIGKNKKSLSNTFDKSLDKVQAGVDVLNFVNKTQEFITRRAVLLARLDEIIRANPKRYNGKTLEQLIKDGEHKTIRVSDIAAAIDKALEVTFASDFNIYKGGYQTIAGSFIKLINSLPFIATSIIPFPRFLMNSLRFHAEFSPFGFFRFLNPKELTKISRGDTSGLSRALLGTSMLIAAMSLRKQDYAGEKWYEFRIGDRTVDSRPFNPFAAYLFVGDLINKMRDGKTLRDVDLKDFVTVFAGIRGTTGLYLFDQLADYAANADIKSGDPKALGFIKRYVGELLARYLTPLQNVTDVIIQIYPEMGKAKDVSGQELIGPLKKRLLVQDMPDVTYATKYIIDKNGNPKAAPIIKQDPLITQFTGLGFIAPKNEAEKEFDRLQFKQSEIFRSTKIPELDRAYKDVYSYLIGYGVSQMVKSKEYQSQSDKIKVLWLKEAIKSARQEAKQTIQNDATLAPYLLQYDYNRINRDERNVIDEVVGIDYINALIEGLKKESK